MLMKVLKKMEVSLHALRSRREIFPGGEGGRDIVIRPVSFAVFPQCTSGYKHTNCVPRKLHAERFKFRCWVEQMKRNPWRKHYEY